MKIIVKAKTGAKIDKVERVRQADLNLDGEKNNKEPITYKVSVKEAPVAGRANLAIIKALADYFDISPARINLLTGQTSKQKIFEIL